MGNRSDVRILMCRPDHFGVSYAINPWMDPSSWAGEARALETRAKVEWRALHRTLKTLGATIELVPAVPGLPDLVFTANAAVVMDRVALMARFRHPERQGEEPHYQRAFHNLQALCVLDEVRLLPEGVTLEGAGDCVWDRTRGIYWMGYGPRSDRAARDIVADCFGIETVALELADPRFYHMDTALCPLSGGEVLYVPGAFTAEGLGRDPRAHRARGSPGAGARRCRAFCRQRGVPRARYRAVGLQRRAEEPPYRARLPRAHGALGCLRAQRRLGLLPDLAARQSFGCDRAQHDRRARPGSGLERGLALGSSRQTP